MCFTLKRGQQVCSGLSLVTQQSSVIPHAHSVFLRLPCVASPPIDSGSSSLCITKSVLTVLLPLGTYVIASPAAPVAFIASVSSQAFRWSVEIKGKGHSPACKQHSEPGLGTSSAWSTSFQIRKFCWVSGHPQAQAANASFFSMRLLTWELSVCIKT